MKNRVGFFFFYVRVKKKKKSLILQLNKKARWCCAEAALLPACLQPAREDPERFQLRGDYLSGAKCAWAETHNPNARFPPLNAPSNYHCTLTWPGREFDQKGTTPSVEQGHCTLIAVKRYRDPPRIGGRHNFLLWPLPVTTEKNYILKRNAYQHVLLGSLEWLRTHCEN